ncbi:MAG TPA: SH3 domain-containing protein [Anaerolineales bacterium]|nr:SH3 domain-containing protein [Anaerolineales bacterium]
MKSFLGRNLALAIIALVLAGLACNLPEQKSATTATPTTGTEGTSAATQTPASTTTSSTPTVTVSAATNCRTGPGTNYDLVLIFQPGATAEVVGKYTPTNYWIIKTPTGGTCWLWGAYATVQGDTSSLAEIEPPASGPPEVAQNSTNTPKASKAPKATATATNSFVLQNPGLNQGNILKALFPSAPSSLSVTTTCTYKTIFPLPPQLSVRTDHLSWSAVSNATGYYVYENGSKISSTIGTSINLIGAKSSGNISFGVASYNSLGTSSTTSKNSTCP